MRCWRQRIEIALAACAVEVVSAVSGFTQTNSAYRVVTAGRTASGVFREYVAHADFLPVPSGVPANLIAAPIYQDLLESMLRRSPTFRRQCLRLMHSPEVTVTLQAGSAHGPVQRARTRIVKTGGRLVATIEILRLENPVELIAHEIEHIIEQLDGIDLASRARVGASGVHEMADVGAFETSRAKHVGLMVSAEVRRAGG